MGAPKLDVIEGGNRLAEQAAEVPHLRSASQIPVPIEQVVESRSMFQRFMAWWKESEKKSNTFWDAMWVENSVKNSILTGRSGELARMQARNFISIANSGELQKELLQITRKGYIKRFKQMDA